MLVRGWSGQSNVSVSARIVNASDVNPSDNYASVSVYAGYPLADLALQNLNCPPDAKA